MTKIVVDASLDAKLTYLQEPVELCDESGRSLGFLHPVAHPADTTDVSPFSEEEIERRRQHRSVSSQQDVLNRLNRR